jgi:DNA transformation protein
LGGAGDPDHIAEMFSGFGPVAVRRMFSGAGVFADGLMIAIAVGGVIYLKTDEADIARFAREGLEPFRYRRKGALQTIRSFWRMPERLYDDPDELAEWAARAMAAARRADTRAVRGPARRTGTRVAGWRSSNTGPSKRGASKARRRPHR